MEIGAFGSALKNLITEVFALIRIIQRCGATVEFKMKLSPDTGGLFSWASDFLSVIFNDIIPLEHLTEKDKVILLGFASYLSYSFLILSVFKSAQISFHSLFGAGLLFLTGYGFSLLPNSDAWLLIFMYPIVILITLIIACFGYPYPLEIVIMAFMVIFGTFVEVCHISKYQIEYSEWDVRIGVWLALIAFAITSAPVICKKDGFSITTIIVSIVIIIIEIPITFKLKDKMAEYIIKCFRLLSACFVIPIISNFIELTNQNGSVHWSVTLFVIAIPVFSTFLLIALLTLVRYEPIVEQYQEGRHYYEIFDLVCKYAYAFFSGYDNLFWGCIAIEIITIVAIIVVRPYNNISDYGLNIGECIVVLFVNLFAKLYSGMFSLAVSITLLALGFLPVLISVYLFVIFDFRIGDESETDQETNSAYIVITNLVIIITVLLGFFFYGLCVSHL